VIPFKLFLTTKGGVMKNKQKRNKSNTSEYETVMIINGNAYIVSVTIDDFGPAYKIVSKINQ